MLTGPRRKASDAQGRAAAPRPLGRRATAVSAALERAWSLPPRTNYVAVERGLRVPMSDGTTLLADHYLPITVVSADRRLRAALDRMPISAGARELLGTGAPWFEILLEHPQLTDSFWEPMQCGAALDRISAPTLLVGAWQDIFLEQTLEQYRALAARRVPTRLLVGPWTHQDTLFKGRAAVAESLAWLDRYAGTGAANSEAGGRQPDHSVRIWVGGRPHSPSTPRKSGTTKNSGGLRVPDGLRALRDLGGLGTRGGAAGEWREISGWPPAGTSQQRWYLGAGGTLGPAEPAAGADVMPECFRYDPADPTPSVGGATLALNAGMRDNRQVEQRPDVLVFSSEPLDAAPADLVSTRYTIGLSAGAPSALLLAAADHAAAETAGKAALHA